MAEHNYKFNITMTCGGCSGAVERVLKKLDGETTAQAVTHQSSIHTEADVKPPGVKNFDDYATVLEKIKKTGKAVNSGEADGVAQAV
jgi:copper chaperone